MIDRETFRSLPTEQVAALVQQAGPKVCLFPINGTRRWFLLEHPPQPGQDMTAAYLDITGRRHIELYRLFFEHGVSTLLTPIFGADLLERGEDYIRLACAGMDGLVSLPHFREFYESCDVRVRFYGDYEHYLTGTPYAHLLDQFAELMALTADHRTNRLFYGVFAQDATETTAAQTVQYFQKHGRVPDKRALIEQYYGEYVPPVSFFIGLAPFYVYDAPLLLSGAEDLYFTISPSPYLDAPQLRDILYDHLYARPEPETDYTEVQPVDWERMRAFYHANREHTLGIGDRQSHGGYWYPLPQVAVPDGFRG